MINKSNRADFTDFLGKKIGNIQITDYLGEGSMGMVFKGYHENLDIDVAVKVVRDELLESSREEYIRRFEREARMVAKLNHSCITRIIDYGQFEGRPYIVIDFVDGFTLDEFVKAHYDHVEEMNILKLLRMTSSAVHEAHRNGIINRDIKPKNILLSRQGRPFITDLGLARDISDSTITRASVVMGSPAFMAPETFNPEAPLDKRSDIYSLGCVAYYMAFRRLPVSGATVQDIIHGHLSGMISFDHPTACGNGTIEIIKRMMAFDLEKRFQSANHVVESVKRRIISINEENRARLYESTQEIKNFSEIQAQVRDADPTSEPSAATSPAVLQTQHTSTDSFLRVDKVIKTIEKRIGQTASTHSGKRIVHTALRERLILWMLFIGFVMFTVGGYLYSQG